ncbi:glycosyltransferase [Prochlorococcus sp. MIT 1300]|uniref:glycosyltransferase n=1 Tax=Prochlorococcus sp. MIT 1300 TaxID=3096218 RepID=UPI002A763069|nr:glycosyltransferase [Prochlorococcus sp. MIT 1300]
MRILISHPNHPAQFRRLAPYLADQGHELIFLYERNEWNAPKNLNYRLIHYSPHRSGGGPYIHPYLRRLESAVLQGQAVFRVCEQLRREGWVPDVVINHVGFGNGLYLSDVFPQSRRIGLFEWYYNADDSDVDFLNKGAVSGDRRMRLRGWNAQTLLELAAVDCAVTPTVWQQQQFPEFLRNRFHVIHEGIDVEAMARLKPLKGLRPFGLPNDKKIEVVTYLSRGFETYRGFPQAMEAMALVQKQRPNVHLVLAGSDEVAYGPGRSDGRTWRQWATEELPLDPERTHWVGILQEPEYHQLLACSQVHLYLTVPFVLSWSLLEAMAAGCSLVASATPPVMEVLENGKNGLLVDFWDSHAQAAAIQRLLDDAFLSETLANQAQNTVSRYTSQNGLRAWETLLVCEDTNETATHP